ncbi:MAG: hypothetical protein ACI9VR_002079, partial [Cognaticolwellia sp.]
EKADETLVFSASALWDLDEPLAGSLGLQKLSRPVTIKTKGRAGGSRYAWRFDWGRQAEVEGPWLRCGATYELLPAAILKALQLSEELHDASQVQVFRALLRLQKLAEDTPLMNLATREAAMKIEEATQVRVVVDEAGDLQPKLVGATQDGPALDVPVSVVLADPITRATQDTVVKLDNNSYLLLDKGAFSNFLLTEAARETDPETKQRFLENPLAFLPDENAFDEAHYSGRVLGVSEAPRASGAGPTGERDWIPDQQALELRVAGRSIAVTEAELPALVDALETALSAGDDNFDWMGAAIPASAELLSEVRRIGTPLDAKTDEELDAQPGAVRILHIQDNDLVLEWQPIVEGGRVQNIASPRLAEGVKLKRHQLVSLRTLQRNWHRGLPGSLLCDDMGLGKTLQGLAFADWVTQQRDFFKRQRKEHPGALVPILIVAPPSLMQGWLEEAAARMRSGTFQRVLWGGGSLPPESHGRDIRLLRNFVVKARRGGSAAVLEHARLDMEALGDFAPDVLVVGYDTLRSLQFAVGEIRFGLALADECQAIKNPGSLRSHALRAMNYSFGLALTGTPIENSWVDLWTISDFAIPGTLGPLDTFRKDFPSNGDVHALGSQLATTLSEVMIRRTRLAALKSLPPRKLHVERETMPVQQSALYSACVQANKSSGAGVLGLLQKLGRVSLHPRIRAELQTADAAESWFAESARTNVLFRWLRKWENEAGCVLVFVRSKNLQSTLKAAIELRFGAMVGILNGSVSMKDRHALVEKMRVSSGFRVLIVNPEIGGAGWNLQFSCRSVVLERPFNPAVEAQLIARTWRLGQEKEVEVVLPVATLEERVSFDEVLAQLLEDKQNLSDSVLAPVEVSQEEKVRRFGVLAES